MKRGFRCVWQTARALLMTALCAVLLTSAAIAAEPTSATLNLPYANENGYSTTRVIVNPTADAIKVAAPCKVGPCLVDVVQPHSSIRTADWPRAGVNVETITLDSRLVAYVEFRTPLGTITRRGSLAAVTQANFYDLPSTDTFESHVFVAATAGTFVSFTDDGAGYRKTQELGAGAALAPVIGPRVVVWRGYGPGYPRLPEPDTFYAFAIVVHRATGAITISDAVN